MAVHSYFTPLSDRHPNTPEAELEVLAPGKSSTSMPRLPATLNPRPASDLTLCPVRGRGTPGQAVKTNLVTELVPAGPNGDRTAGVRGNTWTRGAVTYPGFYVFKQKSFPARIGAIR